MKNFQIPSLMAVFIIIFLANASVAQDYLRLKSGSEHWVTVEYINNEYINFIKKDTIDGTVRHYRVHVLKVDSIRFNNGFEKDYETYKTRKDSLNKVSTEGKKPEVANTNTGNDNLILINGIVDIINALLGNPPIYHCRYYY